MIFDMNRKQKRMLLRIIVAAAMLIVLHFLPVQGIPRLLLYLLPYFVAGYDVAWEAVRGIGNGQLLDENFLMTLATAGAFVLGAAQTGDYFEAVAVMLFYQIGELFQSFAVGKSRKSIAALMDIRPEYARVEQNGNWVQTDPEEVPEGALIRVDPGERIPLDGVVLEGTSALDTAALTGESVPRDVQAGDMCSSGCINLSGVLVLRTTKVYTESTVARVLELVENAAGNKSRSEKFISRFARVYTPAVCIGAVLLAVLPPLWDGNWLTWLYRGLTFLVASCPCALVISIPLTFFAGIGGAGKAGVLVKGANYLEALSKTQTVVFDKTGTLTQGSFAVTKVWAEDGQKMLYYGAMAEKHSSHPIGKSLQAACQMPLEGTVSQVQELSGYGVTAMVDGVSVAVGNQKLMQKLSIDTPSCEEAGTVVYVALDGKCAGYILLGDEIKAGAEEALKQLRAAGVTQTVMLTGDHATAAEAVAKSLGIDRFLSNLLPDGKVTAVETLLQQQKKGAALAFAGDGINDAPVLSRADIGIAMGAMGSDAAIEAADVVLMDDDLRKLPKAIRMAKKCMAIVYQNILLAVGIKLLCLLLVALGVAGMGLAIFADVGVMVLAVLNASRALLLHK